MSYQGYAALPTGETINPRNPVGAPYYAPDLVAFVLFKTSEARTRPTRVYTSYGHLGIRVGDEIDLYHDQTGAQLGRYRVSGIHDFASGEMAGEVPDIKIKHCVAK